MKYVIKISIAWIAMTLLFILSGCQTGTASKHPDFLTGHQWTYYTNCDETISFGEDGSYCYYCACGNSVGNSDLFDSYKYKEKDSEIILSPKGNGDHIKVLRYEKSRLLLEFEDGVKEFFDKQDPVMTKETAKPFYDPKEYTWGYSSYLNIIEKKEDTLITSPAGYDSDISENDTYFIKEKLAKKTEFYKWQVRMKNPNTDETVTCSYKKLSENQVESMLKNSPSPGYIWYNSNGEIEKITFYSETSAED